MNEFQAIVLGLIQGLTEFLPVSSSGHLVIGKALFGIQSDNLSFEVIVHFATVCSTIVAFRKEIWKLLSGFFKFKNNEETQYIFKILVSMIPVGIIGVFFKDKVEVAFGEGIQVVGFMLMITAVLLLISEMIAKRHDINKIKPKEIGYKEAIIIGIAQAFAVLPGISRSGSTIATGLMCGVKKSSVAQFSFLMVLIPILGEAFLDLIGGNFSIEASGISALSLGLGALTAFISGYFACRWMINIVKKSKLIYFSAYCAIVSLIIIISSII
ncbi:MAG: undecaprenyl-diphosphate phosphatase [Bacteroidales bacterium]